MISIYRKYDFHRWGDNSTLRCIVQQKRKAKIINQLPTNCEVELKGCPKAVLAAKLLAVESQLAVCKHQIGQRKRRRPRFTASFRLLWVVLSKFLDEWEDLACLMQPATVKKWHTTAFRYFWRWKSRRKGGRPPISKEMQVSPRKTSSALSLQHLRELATCDQLYYLGRLNAIRNLLTNLCSVLGGACGTL
jgi:hypothetical protein